MISNIIISFFKDEDAVTVAEFAIVLSLITLAMVSTFNAFKTRIEAPYVNATTAIPS